ncbi:hypothetical protein ACFV6Z_18790 [Streptomyces sp. NPDC059818]|uniref:hypothetical protein n=1 Tax=Streptomyces sp. NPDC059818 TaxID=3346962 RepID=UPI00365C8CC2
MTITRTLRRAAAVALLAVLPVLALPVGGAVQPDRTAVVADPGWGAVKATEPPAEPARTDPGWG